MDELTDDVRSFLGGRRYAVLSTHDPDGGIHVTPIWFLFQDDRFYFASSSRSRKVKNLEKNVSASVVVDAREPGRARWVSRTSQRGDARGACRGTRPSAGQLARGTRPLRALPLDRAVGLVRLSRDDWPARGTDRRHQPARRRL